MPSAARASAGSAQRHESRLRELLAQRFLQHVEQASAGGRVRADWSTRIAGATIDPYAAAADLVQLHAQCRERRDLMKAVLDHVGIAVQRHRGRRWRSTAMRWGSRSRRRRTWRRSACGRTSSRSARPALELLEATAPDSAIAKYVEKRGPGIHHITLRVDDIRAALAQLQARGVRLVDEEPRPGAEGALVAFIHPSAAHGVLVELKQARGADGSRSTVRAARRAATCS